MTDSTPLLELRGLTVGLASTPAVNIVDGVDLVIGRGERVALVGESGSGKSVTARAIMRLDPTMRLTGEVVFDGRDLVPLKTREMAKLRGSSIAMVFQDPLRSLNPVMTIGAQVAEPLIIRGMPKRDALARAREILDQLGVTNVADRMKAYPFEFSGGMRQRVALAIALAAEPRLLIADEPTTALDTRMQEKVLSLLDRIAAERELSVLLITHDLGVVAGFADRVAVMYAGRKIEDAPVDALYANPLHPYTRGLLEAVLRIDRDVVELAAMPGTPVRPDARPAGCAFAPRCAVKTAVCEIEVPALRVAASGTRSVACFVANVEAA